MSQYRQVLVRMRQGDPDRAIARSGLMGRRKLAAFRALCEREGWLDPTAPPPPEDAQIAATVGHARRAASTISSAEEHRERVAWWVAQGVSGVAIHAALCRAFEWFGRVPERAYCLVLDGESFRAPRLAPGGSKAKVASNGKTAQA